MKKIGTILMLLLFCSGLLSAQIRYSDQRSQKYFISASYGVGEAMWFSKLVHTDLYGKDGGVIQSGNIVFRAKNSTTLNNYEVSFPVAHIRMGMGIGFEKFYLDKLVLKSTSSPADKNNYILFDESFRFDKFYALVEVPFKYRNDKNYSFNFIGHLGYFGINGLSHLNFFGDNSLARTYLANAGIIADFEIFNRTYLFLNPNIEYKYFRNNKDESPSVISHNIISGSVLAGIRINLSKY